jgi:hypothetical protein
VQSTGAAERRRGQRDASQSFDVLATGPPRAGTAREVFRGDTIFQNHFLVGSNLSLGENLVTHGLPTRTQAGQPTARKWQANLFANGMQQTRDVKLP